MARDEAAAGDIETDPLLLHDPEDDVASVQPTPLPKVQLGALFAIKLLLPVSHTQIMPYINELVEKLASANGANTGYYSGLVGTTSSIAHLLTLYYWARASDRVGRIPVIVAGTIGIAISTLLFGLSSSFGMLLVTRCLIGIFSGTTGAIHSVVGELTDDSNQKTAFPLYDIVSAVGFAVGPLIGGTFADPATQYPGWFTSPIWTKYPYFLPCLVTAILAGGVLFLAIFVLEETLPTKRKLKIPDDPPFEDPTIPSVDADAAEYVEAVRSDPLSVKALLSIPVIRHICATSAALGFLGSCFNTVMVLMAYTPIDKGGLAFPPRTIGNALAVMGFVSIPLKLTLPSLLRRFGVLSVFRFCLQSWPITFTSMALLSFIAKGVQQAAEGKALEWTAVGFTLFLSRVGTMAFSLVMILTKDHTPGTTSLGTSNGMAEFAQSLAGALGPTTVSSLFAFSVSNNVLGGYLWVIVMVLISLLGGSFPERIRKYRGNK